MTKYCPVSCSEDQMTLNSKSKDDCDDTHPRCSVWAKLGDCDNNFAMRAYCAESCNTCQEAVPDEENLCKDTHENCRFWADSGECSNNENYMHFNCPMSCGTCDKVVKRADTQPKTPIKKLDANEVMAATAKFGDKQLVQGNDALKTLSLMEESIAYMGSDQVTSLASKIRDNCRNKHELCSFWAYIGTRKFDIGCGITCVCFDATRYCAF
jgi:hypothetical protein